MKVEIYDPAMCCSSGLCGPSIDPVLIKMNDTVLALKKQGIEIERYSLAQQPKEFTTTARNSEAVIGVAVAAFPGHPLVYLAIILGPVVELPMLLILSRIMLGLKERIWGIK